MMKFFDKMSKPRKNKPEPQETEKEIPVTGQSDAETTSAEQTGEVSDSQPCQENSQEEVIAALNKKNEELNDKFLRLYSEFDNYRKRVIKEKADLHKNASEEMIISLLPLLDDFERAIASVVNKEEIDPVNQGIILIYNKLKNILIQKGVQETEAMGLTFDTDFHEAIANVPATSEELKNKIIDVTQKGYTLNGKVIRFAKVVVGN